MDAVLWKQHFRIHPDLQIVTPEPAHILNDNALNFARLDVGKHPLESGPVEVGSRISVVLVVMADSCIAVIPAILFQNSLLERDLSRVFFTKTFAVIYEFIFFNFLIKDRQTSVNLNFHVIKENLKRSKLKLGQYCTEK